MLKKVVAIVLCCLLLLSDSAKATVVFTDSFTVGADINLDAYPSGSPNWAMNIGTSASLVVTASTDNVVASASTDNGARITNAAAPTGDQQITAAFHNLGTVGLLTRAATDGSVNYYIARFNGTTIKIQRLDNTGENDLTECTVTYGTDFTGRFKATGTGATISLEAQADSQTACTVNDSAATRKTSGKPGIYVSGAGSAADDVSVDDLISDVTPPVRSNGEPTGTLSSGTTQTNITLDTDENATCKYGTTPGVAYGSIANTFSTTGGTSHSQLVTGLSNGGSYNYYVRCIDGSSNANTNDYTISFSVASSSLTTLFSARRRND